MVSKELKESNKFKNMSRLTEMIIPQGPAILSSGTKEKYNSMAIGWAQFGVVWRKPVVSVYVKPERYTFEFMEKNNIFTVSFFDKEYSKVFSIYGGKSGRDVNKENESGLHIKFLDNGGITFEEANEVYVCRIIYKHKILVEEVDKSIIELYESNIAGFKSTDPHGEYVGEIIGHYVKE